MRQTSWRRIWAVVKTLGVACSTGVFVGIVLAAEKPPETAGEIGGIACVFAVALQVLPKRRRAKPLSDKSINKLADRLARQVGEVRDRDASDRGLLSQDPMPVRWHWSHRPLTGPPAQAVRSTRFGPLPGFPSASTDSLQDGYQRDLLDIFGGLASGRVVIIGQSGSGKSSAAILLLRTLLQFRSRLRPDERALVPVPVLISPGGWDPLGPQRVQDWLAQELPKIYPILQGEAARTRALINTPHRLAVFLDALDDLPETMRGHASATLSRQATFRLLILSSTDAMVAAVPTGHLTEAAVLEQETIRPADAADYLYRCYPLPGPWRNLTQYLRNHPLAAVSTALKTPLMVTLVRDGYRDENPAELLTPGSLPDPLEEYLLDRLMLVAYPRRSQAGARYSHDVATRALTYIATRMREQTDKRTLAWWDVPRWKPAVPRILITSVLLGLTGGLVFGLGRGPKAGVVAGLLAVIVEALGQAGLLGPLGPPKRLRTVRWRRVPSRYLMRIGPAIGLACGVAGWITGGFRTGLVFGVAVWLAVWVSRWIGQTVTGESPTDPLRSWRDDRNYGLLSGLVVGLVGGPVLWAALGPTFWVWSGAVSGLVIGLLRPDTWRTSLAAGQLWLSGVTPLRLMRFLADAHRREVLRTVGSFYQFRHVRLQDHLAKKGAEGR